MRSVFLLAAVLGLFWSGVVLAQEKPVVQVEIVPPPLEGTVSLGVFDAKGKCVRVLAKNAAQDSLPAALNGWAISWDGKTADGREAPAGNYEIRGYIVGDVKVEGVAWHFNDWVDPEHPEDAPVGVKDVEILPGGDFLLLYFKTWIEVARFGPDGTRRWVGYCILEVNSMTVGSDKVTLYGSRIFQDFSLDKGEYLNGGEQKIWSTPIQGLGPMAIWNGKSLAARGNHLVEVIDEAAEAQEVTTFPAPIRLLAAKGNLVAASDGSKLWLWKGSEPEELPTHPDGEILDLTFGGESTLWWIAKTSEGRTLHSLSLADGKERELVPDNSSGTMSAISVSADDHTIALLNRDEQTTTFRILRLIDQPSSEKSEPGQIVSYWKTLLQRQITPCGEFGFNEKGELIAQGKIDAHQSLQIPLIENPLTPEARSHMKVRPAAEDGGVWISSSDGLPLIPVASGMVSSRVAIVNGKQPDSARVFLLQSVGIPDSILQPAAVAEYAITGLQNMMTFTAGSVQWPPGPQLKPDESDVPSATP